jgi:hypothetical protein
MKLFDKEEHFLRIQPFLKQGIYLKRKGDRYILVGNTREIKGKLERAGFRFNHDLRAWLMPPRKPDQYIYKIVGDALGIEVDMRKYKHLIGKQRSRKTGHMRPDRSVSAFYMGEMLEMIDTVKARVNALIMPILKRTENQYRIGGTGESGYLKELTNAFKQIRGEFNFEQAGKTLAEMVLKKSDKVNRQRFINHIKTATGMDLTTQI